MIIAVLSMHSHRKYTFISRGTFKLDIYAVHPPYKENVLVLRKTIFGDKHSDLTAV